MFLIFYYFINHLPTNNEKKEKKTSSFDQPASKIICTVFGYKKKIIENAKKIKKFKNLQINL